MRGSFRAVVIELPVEERGWVWKASEIGKPIIDALHSVISKVEFECHVTAGAMLVVPKGAYTQDEVVVKLNSIRDGNYVTPEHSQVTAPAH